MNEYEVKYCPQCGADGVATRQVTPNHIVEFYCPHCGVIAILLWREHTLIGTSATHDPESDSEAW